MLRRLRRRNAAAQPDLQRLAQIFDARAEHWDEREGRGEIMMVGNRFLDRLVSSLEGDVLEIGVGAGETLRRLQGNPSKVTSYTGIDISTGMLAKTQRYANTSPFPVRLLQANAESLSMFADNTFDTVTGSLVLCTVPDQEQALRELARVVKPDGRVVLIEHVLARNPILKGAMKVAAPLQVRQIGCHIDRRTDQIIRKLGFRVEEDESRIFGVIHLIVARPPQQGR